MRYLNSVIQLDDGELPRSAISLALVVFKADVLLIWRSDVARRSRGLPSAQRVAGGPESRVPERLERCFSPIIRGEGAEQPVPDSRPSFIAFISLRRGDLR